MTGPPPHLEVETDTGEMKTIWDSGECRILGINIQANMTWISHLERGKKALLPSIRRQLGALQQMGSKLPRKCRKTLAEGLIISRLLYLIQTWGSTTENHLRRAQVLLNRTARWITGQRRRTRIRDIMIEVGWLDIKELHLLHSCVYMWKMINLITPQDLRDKLIIGEDNMIETKRPRLLFTSRGLRWKSTIIWN